MEALSLKEYLIQDTDYTENYFLYAEGGMGKTTQLLNYNDYLLDRANNGSKTIPIYIDAKKLKKSNSPICDYVEFHYCKGAEDKDILKMLSANRTYCADYEFLIIVDGINENTSDTLIAVMGDINDIIEKSSGKTRFIVSARNERKLNNFKSLKLKPLNETHITDYVKEKFNIDNLNNNLIRILQIPMFFRTFIETYKDKDSKLPDNYCDNKTIVRKADLLKVFLDKLKNDREEKNAPKEIDIDKLIVDEFLPKLAFEMSKNNAYVITRDTIESIYNELKIEIDEYDYIDEKPNYDPSFSITIRRFSFLNKISNDNFAFTHQYWRDYFAAQYIVNQIRAKKIDDLIYPIDSDIRRFVGEILGECEFESKSDTVSSMSPVEEFMQNNYSQLNEKPMAIRNLIEIMKTSRNNCITANYSNLDLSDSNFNNCYFRNSNFENSIIDDLTFFNDGHDTEITALLMLNDNKTLVSGDARGIIKLWNIETTEIINQIDIKSEIKFLGYWNNETIIAICFNGTYIHYNLKTHKFTKYRLDVEHIYSVEMSLNNKLIVLNALSGLIILVKKEKHFECIKRINMVGNYVKSFSISPDNKTLIYVYSNSGEQFCCLYDAENDKYLPQYFHINKTINNLFFKNNNKLIIDFEDIGFVEYSLEDDTHCTDLNIKSSNYSEFSYNISTETLIFYDFSDEKLVIKENLNNSKTIHIKNCIDRDDSCSCLNHSDNGKFVLLGTCFQNEIYIYDIENPHLPYKVFDGKNLNATSHCENKDYFYFGTMYGNIFKADKADGRIVDFYNFSLLTELINQITISSNGKYLAFSDCRDCRYSDDFLFVFDMETNNILCEFKIKSSLNEIAFSDDCNVVVIKNVLNDEKDFFDISSLIGSNNINIDESVRSADENIDNMKYFIQYKQQIKRRNDHFTKYIEEQVIWENRDLVNECLIGCDFRNAKYIGTNESEFYKKLYLNGAIVPPEFQ